MSNVDANSGMMHRKKVNMGFIGARSADRVNVTYFGPCVW